MPPGRLSRSPLGVETDFSDTAANAVGQAEAMNIDDLISPDAKARSASGARRRAWSASSITIAFTAGLYFAIRAS
jgi:hypothetical protein